MRKLISVFIILLVISLLIPVNIVGASLAGKVIAYITWNSFNNVWDVGTTLNAEASLNDLTDIVAPAVNPNTAASPTIVGMYGSDLSHLGTVATAGHNHSLDVAPYLYTDSSGDHGPTLSQIVSAGKVGTLVSSIDSLLSTYDLDGIVLDPEDGSSSTTLNTVISALYATLHPEGKYIDITGPPYGSPSITTTTASSYIRMIQVMCYDMGWGNSPNGYPQSSIADSEAGMEMWSDAGFSKSQLIMGIPFYGRTAYDTYKSPYQESMDYVDIVSAIHPSASTDHAVVSGRDYWWGGPNTDVTKTQWEIDNGYAGVMVFDLGYDDLNTSYSLMTAVYDTMNSTEPPAPATLTSISVTPSSPSDLVVGGHQQFAATGHYDDNSTQTITSSSTWTSSNTSVATISSGGLTTGVASGSTLIKASKSGINSSNITLTVINPTLTSITLSPSNPAHLNVGSTQQFTSTGHYSNNTTSNLSSSVSWVSSDDGVATISGSGLATGVNSGATLISANMSGVFSSNITLTVKIVSSVVVTPNPPNNLAIGSHQQFVAKAYYSDSSNATVTTSSTWASSDNSVATISTNGYSMGVSGGTANITATYGGITSNSVLLTVLNPAATLVSIDITPSSSFSLDIGETQQFEAIGNYNDNTTATITSSVLWVVSDGALVNVSSDGLATASVSGTVRITAFLSGKTSSSVSVTVNGSITPVIYDGTNGTNFAKSFFPLFVVIIPILLALKMFDANEHPLTGIFVVMILMIIAIAFLPTIQGLLDGL